MVVGVASTSSVGVPGASSGLERGEDPFEGWGLVFCGGDPAFLVQKWAHACWMINSMAGGAVEHLRQEASVVVGGDELDVLNE